MANKAVQYIKQSSEELKKVTWPSKKRTINDTLMVIGISLFVAAFLGILDYFLLLLLNNIIFTLG